MADIVLFHSILGLRPAERALAAVFRAGGHRVALPDLYDGATAGDYEAGFHLHDRVGDAAILERAAAALEAAPAEAVLAGISFGAFLVGQFWSTRPRMAGALLISGVAPWMTPRRARLPVQVHLARPDPFDDEGYFADWAEAAGPVALQLYRYAGAGHYFLDESLPDYDEEAAGLCLSRCSAFLDALDA